MNADLDKLAKILIAEREDGCQDRIVIGGLDKFLAAWLGEAEPEAEADRQDELMEIIGSLKDYADKPVTERMAALEEAVSALREARQGTPAEQGQKPEQMPQRRPAPSEQPGIGLKSPLSAIRGIRTAQSRKLEYLGVLTIEDLLYFFPRRYDDFSHLKTISELNYGEEVTIIGVVWEAQNQPTRRGMELTKAIISDGTGTIEVAWFNQPYLVRQLTRGRRIVLSGKVDQYLGRLTLQSPQWEAWTGDLTHTGRLVPVYSLTEGLSARGLRTLIKSVVEKWSHLLPDCLPNDLRQSYNLADTVSAIQQIHFPDDVDSLARARRRLCFDEFLVVQLGVMKQRVAWQQQPGRSMVVDSALLERFVQGLPFKLTAAQDRVLQDILNDLQQPHAMSRLLQGDVGSGKTVVALAAMLVAAANGLQAVMMAPTEVLAVQHYHTLTKLLEDVAARTGGDASSEGPRLPEARIGLLIGSLSQGDRDERRRLIANGEVDIVVGTHALIQEGVTFKDLGLAIVDEQHRFGVSQRAALRGKGYNPHVLVMSATPIPRTLALTIYGDLDISVIDELPPDRQKIITKWLAPLERERAYGFVRRQVESGRQAFIICPLIEESDKVETKAAVSEYRRLQDLVFPDLRLALLHGRMRSSDKEEVMTRFGEGDYDILVATPVVEVGIDVPNASVMLVEGADRFGLAQLHQFRGRVGRGEHQSYCLLLAESPSLGGEQRLKTIETTQDGFVLAEEDLKMRGPGEFFGTRQSGLPDLKVAKLGDVRVLEEARQAAQDLFRQDPTMSQPEHQLLAKKVEDFWAATSDLS